MPDRERRLLAPLLLCLWGCALIPRSETQCNANRPCPAGQGCDQQTSTCVVLADLGAPLLDLAAPPCVVDGGTCVPCLSNGDCPSQVCDVYQPTSQGSFRCVPEATLIYVDNRDGTCSAGMGGNGTTPAQAVCTLNEGLALADGVVRTGVRVLASTGSYGPVLVVAKTVALYGPGGEGGTAQLGGMSGVDGIDISGRSDIIVDGFEIAGSRIGVVCNGSGSQASLRLRRSQVLGSNNLGVLVTDCALAMDRDLLLGNQEGALAVGGALPYSVTNTFVAKNQSEALPAIKIAGTGSGSFRFNTVADNTSTLAAGMDCGGQQLRLQDSIFVRNQRVSGSQFQNGCQLANVVVGMPDSAPGTSIAKTPAFTEVGGIDYGLDPGDPMTQMCCIDRALGTIAMDYFGTHRPLGLACDIGAHEAR